MKENYQQLQKQEFTMYCTFSLYRMDQPKEGTQKNTSKGNEDTEKFKSKVTVAKSKIKRKILVWIPTQNRSIKTRKT